MFPYFVIFGKVITTYLIVSLIGVFVSGIFACYIARKRGYDDNDVIVVLLFASIGVIIGGHILYGFTNINLLPNILNADGFSDFLEKVNQVFGGSVFYGGLIGGIITGGITIRAKKLNLKAYSDMLAPAIPLFHSIARVGCFLSGCCYGIESSFGITFHGNELVPEVNDVSRFPVQLMEAIFNLTLFFVLYKLYKKSLGNKSLQGKILPLYLILYSVIRFFDEFLRGDEIRGFVFGISTSQFISILLFVISISILLYSIFNKKQKSS